MDEKNFETFVQAYLVCALWASTECDEGGQNCRNMDDLYDVEDFAPSALKEAREDCEDFCNANKVALEAAVKHPGYTWSSAGHDFWLTRCGHGAGFWDRGLPNGLGTILSEASRTYGNRDPYAGDDGLVYFS